jgi:putative transposase
VPRQRRKYAPALPHLVIARAASGALLFYRDDDYVAYLRLLRQFVRDRLVSVHAFCLLPQEIRLILRPGRIPLGRVIQRLHGSHTLRINLRLQRRGSLFQGRYESKALHESDLRSAVRSVHLLPVRTGFARHAEAFSFSSHCTYLGYGDSQYDFVHTNPVLESFKGTSQFPQKSFAKYVEAAALDPDDDGIFEEVADETPLALQPNIGRSRKGFLMNLAERISLLLSVNLVNLRGPSRRQDLVMARRLMATIAVLAADHSVTEVAKFLRRDKAQISRLVSQGMDLVEADEPFKVLYDSVWHEKKRIIET